MASITIRNLDDEVKIRLLVRAADNGRSMEEKVRLNLRESVGRDDVPEKGLGTAIHELFKPFGGVELKLPPREPMRGHLASSEAAMVLLDTNVVSELMLDVPSTEVLVWMDDIPTRELFVTSVR